MTPIGQYLPTPRQREAIAAARELIERSGPARSTTCEAVGRRLGIGTRAARQLLDAADRIGLLGGQLAYSGRQESPEDEDPPPHERQRIEAAIAETRDRRTNLTNRVDSPGGAG